MANSINPRNLSVFFRARLVKTLPNPFLVYFERRIHGPVFIVGCGRSGTTLLQRLLASHGEVAVYPNEANDLWHPGLYPWSVSQVGVPPDWVDPYAFAKASLERLQPANVRTLRACFGAFQWLHGGRCFVHKSAMITFMLPYVLEWFPGSRMIHIVRDGRAVALSFAKKTLPKIKEFDSYSQYHLTFDALLDHSARFWRLSILEIEKRKRETQGAICEVKYEDLCRDPMRVLDAIARFMEIDPGGYRGVAELEIRDMNYKYRDALNGATLQRLEGLMGDALRLKAYTPV